MMAVKTNKIDDTLLSKLLETFNTAERQQFVKHFQFYLQYGTNPTTYPVLLDDIWEYLGFTRRDNAKRFLAKNFIKDVDYVVSTLLLPTEEQKTRGGSNKDNIMMNVDTFKAMCMTANTEKGKQTRLYYTKMETIFFKYMEKKHLDDMNRLMAATERQTEIQRHLVLIKAYHDRPCVYIVKIYGLSDEYTIVKIGETDDIESRLATLRQVYKDCVLLEVYPCTRPHKYEQGLFKKPILQAHRLGKEELFHLSDELTLDKLKKLVQNYVHFFGDEQQGPMSVEVANKRYLEAISKERLQLLQIIATTQDETTKRYFRDMLEKLCKNNPEPSELVAEEEPVPPQEPASNRKVYKYAPNDLRTPVSVYNSLREAARSTENPEVHDYHIREAFLDNKLVEGHRWFVVDDEETLPESIPQFETSTPKTNPRRSGLVAQIDKDKKKIVNVFPSQNEAAAALNMAACSITIALTKESMASGHYWKMFDDCEESLKQTFKGDVPQPKRPGTCSKKVERIDPHTNEVVEVHPCIQDVCSKYRICHKKMNAISETGEIYKGFIWHITTTRTT